MENAKTDNAALEKLLGDYEPYIARLVAAYTIPGYQTEDLMQEARAAFCAAVKEYSDSFGVRFATYAGVCVNHKLGDLLKGSLASKRKGSTFSLDDGEELRFDLPSDSPGPEEKIIEQEHRDAFVNVIRNGLTNFEYKVTLLYLEGYKYKEIAEKLLAEYPYATAKSVDNALSRVRNKLKDLL